MSIQLQVNGAARQFDGDPEMPLLWYLRDLLQLTGTKFGCGAGLCGACTVHLNGEAVRACQTPRKEGSHDRGIEHARRSSAAKSVGGGERAAMRLLPERTNHAGGGALEDAREAVGHANRRRDARQHLPLRNVSADSPGDPHVGERG